MSYVYVFNATTMEITLRVNNQDAGKVPKGEPDPTSGFKLGKINIERVAGMPEAPKFGSDNSMEVMVDGQRTLFEHIKISQSSYPLARNLQMYLFYSAAVLTYDGQVIWVGLDQTAKHAVPEPTLAAAAAV